MLSYHIENTNYDAVHPLDLFLSMLNARDSIRQYPRRLLNFFNFRDIKGNIKELILIL